MADIIHRLRMRASPDEVFAAIAEQLELRGARGERSQRDPREGAAADFRFGDGPPVAKMRLVELVPGARVAWRFVDGPADWIGTRVTFDLAAEGDATIVRFEHGNWREATDFMGDCSARWASRLFGLKARVETPEPTDLYA